MATSRKADPGPPGLTARGAPRAPAVPAPADPRLQGPASTPPQARAVRAGLSRAGGWAAVTLLTLLVATVGALLIFGTSAPPREAGSCAGTPEPVPVEQVDFEGQWPELLPDDPVALPAARAPAPPAPRAGTAPVLREPRPARSTAALPRPTHSDLLTAQAAGFLEQGHYWSAAGLYLRATQTRPANPDAWYGLALCHYELGQRRAALAAGNRALKLDPTHGGAAVLLGFIAQERGAYDASRSLYERYLAERPDGDYADELRSVLAHLPVTGAASARR